MLGFKPGISGVGSDRFANCATTTALVIILGQKFVYLFAKLVISERQQQPRFSQDLRFLFVKKWFERQQRQHKKVFKPSPVASFKAKKSFFSHF